VPAASHAGPASAAPPSHAVVAAQLAKAQSELFGNRYSAADRTYTTLLAGSPRDGDVNAAYALFLAYRGRLDEARASATRAVALAPNSGRAAAVLCRVDDWSTLFTAADRAGLRAVTLAPSDPLTHLFYSEALADTGDPTAAQGEISAAARLISAQPSAYLAAERHREEGNLAGDRGDSAGQVDAFRSAEQAQPQWLYRTTELVDTLIADNRQAEARQELDSALPLIPGDAQTLATLTDEALFAHDSPAAVAITRRAVSAAPADAPLLDLAGEVAVAANGDINTAVAYFEAALEADRTDAQAARYLLALARYVQHDAAAGAREIVHAVVGAQRPGTPALPRLALNLDATAASGARKALDTVNHVRAAAGLAPVHLDQQLSDSAESHSYYWLFNNLSPTVVDLGIHKETRGLPGYSGDYPWDRAVAFGYPNQRIGEDITHVGDPAAAVHNWVDSVYHRFPILRPDLVAIGYGDATLGPLLIEDMEFGFALPQPAAPLVYPAAGQTNVPAIFVDNELPDPVPVGDPRTTGYPVTVTFPAAASMLLGSFTLAGPDGRPLTAYLLTPSAETENSASLLPVAPLAAGTTYTAAISATVDGRSFTRTWSFTTAA